MAFFVAVAANETMSPYNFIAQRGSVWWVHWQARIAVLEICESRPHLRNADERR